MTVNVNVSNVFDEAPTLTVSNPISLVEELPVGTALGGIYEAMDIEEDDALTFALEGEKYEATPEGQRNNITGFI